MSELNVEIPKQPVADEVWDNLDLETGEQQPPERVEAETADDTQPDREVESESPKEEEPDIPEIYAQTVSISEGEESRDVSVGELKDKYTEYLSREADMERTQTELLRDMAQVNQILANGGPQTQQQVDELNAYRSNYLHQQHEVMMRAHPEWKDQAVMQQAKADMVDVARRYGKSEEMVGQIQSAMDLQMLYDLTRLTKERERAKVSLKDKLKPKPRNPGHKPQVRRSHSKNLGRALDDNKGRGADGADWAEIDKLL